MAAAFTILFVLSAIAGEHDTVLFPRPKAPPSESTSEQRTHQLFSSLIIGKEDPECKELPKRDPFSRQDEKMRVSAFPVYMNRLPVEFQDLRLRVSEDLGYDVHTERVAFVFQDAKDEKEGRPLTTAYNLLKRKLKHVEKGTSMDDLVRFAIAHPTAVLEIYAHGKPNEFRMNVGEAPMSLAHDGFFRFFEIHNKIELFACNTGVETLKGDMANLQLNSNSLAYQIAEMTGNTVGVFDQIVSPDKSVCDGTVYYRVGPKALQDELDPRVGEHAQKVREDLEASLSDELEDRKNLVSATEELLKSGSVPTSNLEIQSDESGTIKKELISATGLDPRRLKDLTKTISTIAKRRGTPVSLRFSLKNVDTRLPLRPVTVESNLLGSFIELKKKWASHEAVGLNETYDRGARMNRERIRLRLSRRPIEEDGLEPYQTTGTATNELLPLPPFHQVALNMEIAIEPENLENAERRLHTLAKLTGGEFLPVKLKVYENTFGAEVAKFDKHHPMGEADAELLLALMVAFLP